MAITYKTVISQAIANFNDIQTALNSIGAKYQFGNSLETIPAVTSDANLVPTSELDNIITEQLQLKPTETYSADSVGTLSDGYYSVSTDISAYKYIKIKAASAGSFTAETTSGTASAVISNTNNMRTITDLSNKTAGTDYFQVKATATAGNASFIPKYTISSAGWISAATYSGSSAAISVSADNNGKSVYIPKATISNDITITASGAINAPEISKNTTAASSSGTGVNISDKLGTRATAEPTSGYFIRLNTAANTTGKTITANASATTGDSDGGYVKDKSTYSATSKSSTVTLSGSSNQYFPITAAALTVTASGTSVAPTISADTTASGNSAVNLTKTSKADGIGVLTTTKPTSAYYINVKPNVGKTNVSMSKSGYTAGYLGNTNQVSTSGSITGSNGSNYYIPIDAANGSLSLDGERTDVSVSANINTDDGSITKLIDITNSGLSTTVPADKEAGTDYFIISATGSETSKGKVKHKFITSAPGYIPASFTKSHEETVNANITLGDSYYLDKGKVTISGDSTLNAKAAATGFTAASTNTGYSVTASITGSVTPKYSNNAGYIEAHTDTTGNAISSDKTATINIPKNNIVGSVVDLNVPSVAISGTPSGITTSSTATNFYVTVSGKATDGSVKGKATAGTTTGIVEKDSTNTSSASTITPSISGSGNNVYIKTGILSNTATSGVTYDEITPTTATSTTGVGQHISGVGSVVIPAKGSLYLNAGYYSNIKISLGTLIPDDATLENAGASHILYGREAYDTDGNMLKGTMPNNGALSNTSIGFVLSDLTLTASATIPAGYTSGKDLSNTYNISELTVAADKRLTSITLNGKGTGSTAGTLSKLTNNGVITTLDGSGVIAGLSGTQTITSLNGSLTISSLGADADSSDIGSSPKIVVSGTTVVQDGKIVTTSVSKDSTTREAKWGTGWISAGSLNTSDICSGTATITQQTDQSVAGYSEADVRSAVLTHGNLTASSNTNTAAVEKGLAKTLSSSATSGYVYTRVTESAGSFTTSGWVESNPFNTSARYMDVKIPADTTTKTAVIAAGTISASVNSPTVGTVTTFNDSTGTKTAGTKTASITGTASATVGAGGTLNVKDKYMLNNITYSATAPTNKTISATATINADATGSNVDSYVESLYKRMLGQTYSAVDPD